MTSMTRTINISWNDIKTPGRLALMFEPPSPNKVQTLTNADAWKVIPFKGNGNATVTFSGLYGAGVSNPGTGNIVNTNIWQAIEPGERTTLQSDCSFTTPVKDPKIGKLMEVKNEDRSGLSMSIGTYEVNADGSKTYSPVFHWSNVGKNSSLQADFHPTLLGYIIYGWKDNQVITGTANTSATAAIWNQNLTELAEYSDFVLFEYAQGEFTVKPKQT